MIFLLLLVVALATLLGGANYAYRKAFYSPYKGRDYLHAPRGKHYEAYREDMERIFIKLADSPFEQISIRSQNGLQLSGRYYHIRDDAPLDICFHGYRSTSLTDLCCFSELACKLGHNLLLPDQRAHGDSKGRTISFGVKERYDVLSWVDYAVERFGESTEIFLYGVSMGASTALMASDLGLSDNVKGIIADCPYSSPEKIIRKVSGKMDYPTWLTWPLVILGAKIFGGFDIRESSAVKSVSNTDVPILLIHGEADGFVPCEMSDEIYRANPELVELHTFPGADHGISYLTDPERYREIVAEFLQKHH